MSDEGGPTNLEREDLIDGEGGFEGVEARWLEEVEEGTRIGYQRGKGESQILDASYVSQVLIRRKCRFSQIGKLNTHPTLNLPKSPFHNSSRFKKKESLHGRSNQITNRTQP